MKIDEKTSLNIAAMSEALHHCLQLNRARLNNKMLSVDSIEKWVGDMRHQIENGSRHPRDLRVVVGAQPLGFYGESVTLSIEVGRKSFINSKLISDGHQAGVTLKNCHQTSRRPLNSRER